MRAYQELIRHVLSHGARKENRTGVDTISTFGYYYEHDLEEGFPLLTTKKIAWKNIVIELLWFLSGTNRSGFLDRHGCGFWKPWYNPPTKEDEFSGNADGVTVNAAYGPAWRRFEYPSYRESETGLGYDGPCTGYNDQIKWVLNKLKTRPMSRDLVVSAWQPHIAQNPPNPKAYLAPCHCMFILNVQNEELYSRRFDVAEIHDDGKINILGSVQALSPEEAAVKARAEFPNAKNIVADRNFQDNFELTVAKGKRWNPEGSSNGWLGGPMVPDAVRQRLCLHLTQRSCDCALGVPYNIASYALLCSLMARFAGMAPGIFGHTLIDAHVYTSKPDGSQAEFDHIPGLLGQLDRKPKDLPRLIIDESIKSLEDVERLLDPKITTEEIMKLFVLEGYNPHPAISFKVAV
jgi:thymidylate synthase